MSDEQVKVEAQVATLAYELRLAKSAAEYNGEMLDKVRAERDALAAQLKEARANQYAARDALMWIMTEAHALELPDLATATPAVRWEIENAALAKEPTT